MSLRRLAVVLIIAAVLAIIIRMFFFETIRITTPAMSESQTIGNRLIIEKFTTGARFPMSIGLPFAPDSILGKKTYFPISESAHRISGFSKIKHDDLIAFNYPIVDNKPIDRHSILLSRCVGLPGENIRLQGTKLYINNGEMERPVDVSICYRFPIKEKDKIENLLKAGCISQRIYQEKDFSYVYLTKYEYIYLTKRQKNKITELKSCSSSFDEKTILIPYKDFRIELNDSSFNTWGALINKYEGVRLIRTESGHFRKNGKEADFYIFKQNYYWMLNDHQGYIDDSRSFGPVPESHIIGKACLIFFSPETKRFLQKI
jgi:signal peptidase I